MGIKIRAEITNVDGDVKILNGSRVISKEWCRNRY